MINPGDPFWMFMCEEEGLDDLVDTRLAHLNAIGLELQVEYSAVDYDVIEATAKNHDIYDLTEEDIAYLSSFVRIYF